MTGYDPNELEEQAQEADSEDIEVTTEIDRVEETTVGHAYESDGPMGFSSAEIDNPNGECVVVYVNFEHGDEEIEVSDIFPLPENELSWHNPQFKLSKFRRRYNQLPAEGVEVQLSIDEETGFLQIDY